MRFIDLVDGASSERRWRESGQADHLAIFEQRGGVKTWMADSRSLYLRFLQLYTEISCVQKTYDEALEKVSWAIARIAVLMVDESSDSAPQRRL
jgi:hypothetical protein